MLCTTLKLQEQVDTSFSKLFVKLQSPLQAWVAYTIILQICRSVVYTLKWDIKAEILAAWPNFSSPQSIAVELQLAGIAVFWVSTATCRNSIAVFEGVLQLCFESAEISSRIQGQTLQSSHHWRQSIIRNHVSFTWQIFEAVHWNAFVNQYPFQLGLSSGAHATIQDLHVSIGFIFLLSHRVLKPLGCTQLGTNHSQAL
jgi:hypothetical protein